jgi:hypothetical protein
MKENTEKLEVLPKRLIPQEPLIFLSYAKEDKDRVWTIYRRLQTERLNPWLDVANLLPGQDWDRVITSTIRNARFVIVFLSNRSVNKRGYVQKEIKEALDVADKMPEGDIFIIPVRLEACIVPERLSRWHWIDIFRPHGFRKIVSTLKENLGPESTATSFSHISAKLIVMGASDHEAMFQLDKTVTLIGRSTPTLRPDVNLARFNSHGVSRRHAFIFREGNSFVIKDCDSTNGTIINDSILLRSNQTRVLKHGDKLRVGEIILHFIID